MQREAFDTNRKLLGTSLCPAVPPCPARRQAVDSGQFAFQAHARTARELDFSFSGLKTAP